MLAVDRTHRLRADRAWLPSSVRNTARLATGAVLTGAGAATVGAVVVAPVSLIFWKALLLGGAGIALAADRVGKAVMQHHLKKMVRGEVELADLRSREEGELVVMRGTIAVDEPILGLLQTSEGIYRRLEFSADGKWVHEAAVNFSLIDESGERVFVEAAGARWLVPSREKLNYPATRFNHDQVSSRVRHLVAGRESVEAFEHVLKVGEKVQVVGYKTTTPDVTGDVVDYRSPPQRATLRSGAELPLVITRVADLG